MNERIRELSKQAWEWAGQQEYNDPAQEFSDILEQKFAELIVQECVRYLNEDYQRDFDTLWREDLSKGIKNHFGVEE